MSAGLLISFEAIARSRRVWLDPLAVSSVEHWAYESEGSEESGSRVVTDNGEVFELTNTQDSVVRSINEARTAFADARRRETR